MKIPKTAQLKEAFCQMYHVLVRLMMGKIACSVLRVLRHLVTDAESTAYRTAAVEIRSVLKHRAGLQKLKETTNRRKQVTLQVCCPLLVATESAPAIRTVVLHYSLNL